MVSEYPNGFRVQLLFIQFTLCAGIIAAAYIGSQMIRIGEGKGAITSMYCRLSCLNLAKPVGSAQNLWVCDDCYSAYTQVFVGLRTTARCFPVDSAILPIATVRMHEIEFVEDSRTNLGAMGRDLQATQLACIRTWAAIRRYSTSGSGMLARGCQTGRTIIVSGRLCDANLPELESSIPPSPDGMLLLVLCQRATHTAIACFTIIIDSL